MIKYLKNILYGLSILTLMYSQNEELTSEEIILDLRVINSGKYSLSSFIDPNVNLWEVNIINNYNGDEIKDLRLEVVMQKDGVNVIWGVTKPIELTAGANIESLSNMNFVGSDLSSFNISSNFENEVQTLGVLPAGQYDLIIRAYILGPWKDRYTSNQDLVLEGSVNSLDITSTSSELLNLNIDEKIMLLSPVNMESIYDSNPWFRWESPAFGTNLKPITVEYRITIALFNSDLHSSLEDALNDETNIFFDSGWNSNLTSIAIGSPEQISIQYPATERELSCGYQYCWRVEARELISDSDFQSYNGGIWGWPEPAKSDVIYSFYYGSSLSGEQISSPSSYINTVLPTFTFANVLCADSYEIWLSDSEDPEVNNPIWKSDYFQTTNYQYPSSSNGLSPGETYFWKIRVNPDTNPGPWSNIFSFTINDISFLSPLDEENINTLFPTFNITSPSNINSYQLLISDFNDPEVNEYNILFENLDFFPYEFPINNEKILSPGQTYFWKVQTIDENGIYTKLINENTEISSFTIKPVELILPENGSYNTSLTPLFNWSAPIGINGYIIEFTTEDDPEFNNIIFNTNVNSPFFLSSNLSGSLPFNNGITYLWRVKAIDNNGKESNPSEYYSFSTILDNSNLNVLSSESSEYSQVNYDVSLTGVDGKDINITIIDGLDNADTYLIQLSDDINMETIIEEIYIQPNSQNHTFSGELLEWNKTYYIQITGYLDDEIIAQPSNINMIIMPSEPGSEQQISFTVEMVIDDIEPTLVINLVDLVENATNYIFRLSENSDMSNFLFSELINTDSQYIYQNSDGILKFGETYYLQLIPIKDNQLHGISSIINNVFIPNIIPPKLSDSPFYFDHSIPESESYLIQISTTEDFAVIFYNEIVESNNISIDSNIFEQGTGYYWRVRGLDPSGVVFGEYSSPKYFTSDGETATIGETTESGSKILLKGPAEGLTVSTKHPVFTWEQYNNAEKYEIVVSKDLDFNDVVWNSPNIFANTTTYPTSGSESLDYDIIYYWTVRPIANNIALADFSDPFSFTISSIFIPEIMTPKEVSDDIKPYFSWSKVQNATKYGLIISNDNDYTSIVYNNQNINDNIFQYPSDAPKLSYNTEYFWKVVAIKNDDTNLGDYSNSMSFKTPSGIIKFEFIFGTNE